MSYKHTRIRKSLILQTNASKIIFQDVTIIHIRWCLLKWLSSVSNWPPTNRCSLHIAYIGVFSKMGHKFINIALVFIVLLIQDVHNLSVKSKWERRQTDVGCVCIESFCELLTSMQIQLLSSNAYKKIGNVAVVKRSRNFPFMVKFSNKKNNSDTFHYIRAWWYNLQFIFWVGKIYEHHTLAHFNYEQMALWVKL